MKNFLLLAGLLVAGISAQAQLALEHRYPVEVLPHKMNTGEVKYVATEQATRGLTIYNQDHSLYRQITIPAGPAGASFNIVQCVSDKLFNQDGTLEYLAFYYHIPPTGSGYYTGRLYTEAGTQLAQMDSVGANPMVFNTATGTKMHMYHYGRDFLLGNTTESGVNIYALGGTLVTKTVAAGSTLELSAFPNPTRAEITLPYQLLSGQTGQLEVMNMLGQTVKTYSVGSHFNTVQLNTAGMAPGTYTYRVTAGGAVTAGNKFVVER